MNITGVLAHILLGASLIAVGCSTTGPPPVAQNTEPASVMEVPPHQG